jgi:hypothetical protein
MFGTSILEMKVANYEPWEREVSSTIQIRQPFAIPSHFMIPCQPFTNVAEDLSGTRISRFSNSIMDPFSIPTRFHQPCPFEVRQMSRDLWLGALQCFDHRADANLVRTQQVNYTQSSVVGQGFEKLLKAEITVFLHAVQNSSGG